MLGSTPLQAVLGSGVNNTDHEAVKAFIRAACGEGLAVMLIRPNSKAPADSRTPQKRNRDDKEAREAAREAGRADWEKVKSPSGLALASTNATTVTGLLKNYLKARDADTPVNLGIELGQSRLIVVDCDTRAQVEAFLTMAEAPMDLPPTVRTPGQRGPDGEWVHSDGGHFYFTVPEGVELPTNVGAMTIGSGDEAFAVLWDRRYVLIPPSTRDEGAYELIGRDYPAPEWLIEKITERAEARAARYENASTDGESGELTEKIDAWAETVSWADILEPHGWTRTARPDGCGCEVWTAPGDHASPKSATAHDPGCSLGRYTETNAPLHIWTDHDVEPFGDWLADHSTSTLSKLQAVSVSEYGGNVGEAMDSLGLAEEPTSLDAETGESDRNLADDGEGLSDAALAEDLDSPSSDDADDEETPSSASAEITATDIAGTGAVSLSGPTEADIDAAPFPDEVEADEDGVFDPGIQGVPRIAPFDYWRDTPPPEYIIEGLIEHRGLSCVIGPPGAGKSTVALDMACHIATGQRWMGRRVLQTKVLYLPGEGLSGAVQRIAAWEQAHNTSVGDRLMLGESIVQLRASKEAWAAVSGYIAENDIGLVIFDTFARMSRGMEENSATEVGNAVGRFDQVRKISNAGVMVVHHTSKGSESARGSSALNGALDSELLVRDGSWSFEDVLASVPDDLPEGKRIELTTTKQKNAEQLSDPLPMLMVHWPENESVIITGPGGTVDPLSNEIVLASPVPEPNVETAIRIRRYVDRLPQQGATRSEIATAVRPDPFTAQRADAAKRWKQKIAEAVDLGLRYGLIETLTGTASGGRYIPSIGTIADARTRAAAEVIGDDDDD